MADAALAVQVHSAVRDVFVSIRRTMGSALLINATPAWPPAESLRAAGSGSRRLSREW
jgi:hypothetical protein